MPQLKANLTARQSRAFLALKRPEVQRLLYGGAKGGGKSFFLCVFVLGYAWDVMAEYNIKPLDENGNPAIPIHIGWMGRKQATDLTGTTLQTWQRTIPSEYYEIKSATDKHPRHILIKNDIGATVAIDFGGLDKQESINKFNSAEYGIIALDQAEETDKDDIAVLQASLRLKINGRDLPYKEVYTANPAQCWLKGEFIVSQKPGNVFVPALPGDNPHLPASYIETLKNSFGYRPELLNAYLFGKWDALEGADIVIKDEWIRAADRIEFNGKLKKRFLTCDIAAMGDDETVVYYMEDTDIKDMFVWGKTLPSTTANKIHKLATEHGKCSIVIDADGVGADPAEDLVLMGNNVIKFHGAGKPYNEELFLNARAEMWWDAGRKFAAGEVELHNQDDKLIEDLTSTKYKISDRNGKIQMECKTDVKSRLGRSPDHGDAYLMGLWALPQIEPDAGEVRNSTTRTNRPQSAMVC